MRLLYHYVSHISRLPGGGEGNGDQNVIGNANIICVSYNMEWPAGLRENGHRGQNQQMCVLSLTRSGESFMKKNKIANLVGSICLAFLAAVLVADAIAVRNASQVGASKDEIPSSAVTSTGASRGMNGDVSVEITATPERIYQIRVTGQNETQGIGSLAVARLPGEIYETQSLRVDGVTGATLTSEAIKNAIREALVSAGFDTAPFEKAPAVELTREEDQSYDVDVVVIGAGGAGMTAAIEAADAGKNVLVLESMPMVGGNSIRSTGGLNAAETDYQEDNEFAESAGVEKQLEAAKAYADDPVIAALADTVQKQWEAYQSNPDGYLDSTELLQLDTMIGGKGLNDPALVKKLADDSNDAIDWLKSIGADMPSVSSFGGASVKRIHRPLNGEGKVVSVGTFVIPVLEENLAKRDVQVLLETTAEEILMDNGKAVGVVARGATGNTVTVNAKAVVIASGGFGANHEWVEQYQPALKGFMSTNAMGIQGQGIKMAMAVGADTVDMDQIQIHPTVAKETGALITEGLRGDGAILVNREGKRFYDEVSTRDKVSAAEIAQTDSVGWLVVDGRMAEASSVIQGYINKGMTVSGDSYEALAEAMGVDSAAFAQTMETWNGYVAARNDPDFGRTSFANPLDTAPYYAILVTPGIHHTMGGVKINDQAQVISTDGQVIPGLYAAGEVTGGVHGGNRLGGNAVADFVVFGRIAGQGAAAYAG